MVHLVKMSNGRTSLSFVNFEVMGDHIQYKITAKDANNQTCELKARYRVLRDIYEQIKEQIDPNDLPEFPPKRLFFNMDIGFVSQRQKSLEHFFNRLLEKYRLEELAPLKAFLNTKNPVTVPEPEQSKLKTRPSPNKQQTSIIDDYKKKFFDLTDNFAPPDMDDPDVRRRKNRYANDIKIDFNIDSTTYKLPVGHESNLAHLHSDTLISHNRSLSDFLIKTLDTIRADVSGITFPNANKIIVNLG